MAKYLVGLDVGSTTVKAIVVDARQTRQSGRTISVTKPNSPKKCWNSAPHGNRRRHARQTRIFITGSGGGTLAEMVGAKFVQEVHAVSLAVEKLHPEVYSVIELGGQDAKIIVFKETPRAGARKKFRR